MASFHPALASFQYEDVPLVIIAILTDERSLLPIAPWIFEVSSLSAASLNADEPAMLPPLPDAEDDDPEGAEPDADPDDDAADPDDEPDDEAAKDAEPDDPDDDADPGEDPDAGDDEPADADDPDDEQAARAMAAPAINATMPRYFLFIPNSFGYRRSDRAKPA
jgi:hypothetical protein